MAVAAPVVAAPNQLPLVGREVEFSQLRRCWELARAGQPQFLLLTGEAGIGKTRLAQEFANWVQLEGATVLRGRAYEVERSVPYSVLAAVLRGALAAPGLAAVDAASLGELSRIVPEFATRFRGVAAPPAADLDTGRVRVLESLRLLFDNLAFERPVLLLVDDIGWADEPTLVALHYVWRGVEGMPLFVLATARSSDGPSNEPLQWLLQSVKRDATTAVHEIALEPLGARSLVQLAAEVGVSLPDEASVSALQEETGGNPLFVGEALRARLEGSEVTARQTVRTVISERVLRLTPAARELLRAAAVLGRRFPFPFAAALAALPQSEAVDALEELLSRRLLQQIEYGYDFLHDIVRETVYEALGSERRRLLHRMALERMAPAPNEEVGLERASALAMHAVRGGMRVEARHWLLCSAELARQLYAGSEAERFLEQALEADESQTARDAILEQIADLRFAQSRFADAALTYYAVLSSSAAGSTDRLRLRTKLLDASLRSGLLDFEGATGTVHEIVEHAEAMGPAYLRDVLLVLASAQLRAGDFQAAEERSLRAVAAARAARDPYPLVRALLLRAQAATLHRSTAEVLPVLEEAVQLATKHDLQREICDAETDCGTELCRQDRWDEAIELWTRVIARGHRFGVLGTAAVAHVNLADVLLRRGEWQRAAEHLDQAHELAQRFNFPHVVADVLVNRALSHWFRDEPEALVEAARAAFDYAKVHGLTAAERNACALRLLGLLALGRDEEAGQTVEVLGAVRTVSHPTWSDDRELAAIARARIAAQKGDRETAIRVLSDALKDAGDSYAVALLQLEMARLMCERNSAAAHRLTQSAAASAARLRAQPLLQRAALIAG